MDGARSITGDTSTEERAHEKPPSRRCPDIMTGSPVTLRSDATLELAHNIISLGRIRHIPVVEDGRLAGLVSARGLIGDLSNRLLGLSRKTRTALLKTSGSAG